MRKTIKKIIAKMFSRITTYLTVFNFCMLCMWLYDSEIGEFFKWYGLRPGDAILVVIFVILFISTVEIVLLGVDKEE